MNKIACTLLPILGLCGQGCWMHTHVGDGMGTPSPDGRLNLAVGIDGAPRHAYVDKTKKTIWIWIGSSGTTNSKSLFGHSYVLTGSDIAWETHWSSSEAVSVKFYDWGDGVGNYNNMKSLTASNHIAFLSFTLDQSTGRFVERK